MLSGDESLGIARYRLTAFASPSGKKRRTVYLFSLIRLGSCPAQG